MAPARTHPSRIRLALAIVLVLAGCGEPMGPGDRPILNLGVVSNPVPGPGGSAALSGGLSLNGAGSASVVYASLPPGSITVPGLGPATLQNQRTGDEVAVTMRDGGFDPVAIAASAGDILDLDVQVPGSPPLLYAMVVPPRRRPIVVRTDPPPGKRDVPLNATMLIVFSEPMDPVTLTGRGITLQRGSTPVAGRLEFADAEHLMVAFVPNAKLESGTTYYLTITDESQDLDGDPLDYGPVIADFTAGPGGQIAFVKGDAGIYLMNADGSNVMQLSTFGYGPSWSPDGTKLAFVSGGGTYVMNRDGSGVTQLATAGSYVSWSPDGMRLLAGTGGGGTLVMEADGSTVTLLTSGWAFPSWSPDGARLTFASGAGIYVASADGSNAIRIADGSGPAWSPDGTRIAFLAPGIQAAASRPKIWIVNPDGSGLRMLNAGPQAEGAPIWSPDGSKLGFQRGFEFLVMTADGAGLNVVRNSFPARDKGPFVWSPDGRYLAFTSTPFTNGGLRSSALYVMSADGSWLMKLTDVGSGPAWRR